MNILNRLTAFLKGVWLEARKVNWPTKKEVLRYTLLVIGVSFALAVFLGGVDFLFTSLLNRIILRQ
ncbi:MAG: preprotein translocase subunit SecE [Candidatus Wildermuthbacteria bacterium GWA2_46_15]|uniref:Protein translocase subunit SecE n=1 Tax=Candidatus Wildermuthbacteria bacterium GWA2_46_15 TaxID=1802443 RepID=A0A1G2QQY4_9BACT|nr:MAG: preprotein translocase subunit SecE [Candidatus Wildermuthbacteria bacterium GWA2_46_15]